MGSRTLNDELARFQRSAGEVIHGRVQGRIVAAALTLSLEAKRLPKQAESTQD